MLNDREERFCEEYIKDLNGMKAAIRAGYSPKTARVQASQLLTRLNVKEKIDELKAERSKRVQIEADDVLRELKSIADEDISNFLSFTTDRKGQVKVTVRDSGDVDTKNVQEVSLGKDGQFKFKLYSRDNALALIGRHLGMFGPKPEGGDDNPDVNLNL